MGERFNSYLSFKGGLYITLVLAIVIGTTRLVLPFMFESFILYPIVKILVFGGITFALVRTRNLDTKYLFPSKKFDQSVGAFIAVIISFFLLQRVVTDLIDLLSLGSEEFLKSKEGIMYPFKQRSIKHFISLVIIGPIVEEVMFRGLIFRSFLKNYSVKKSIILSSILFAFLHLSPDKYFLSSLIFSFLFASFLCWIVFKTENLKIAMGGHMFWNLSNYILLPLIFTLFNVESNMCIISTTYIIMIVIALVMLFLGYQWIRKYYNVSSNDV
jgi:membrane protease YdiL (CAAX protease family)